MSKRTVHMRLRVAAEAWPRLQAMHGAHDDRIERIRAVPPKTPREQASFEEEIRQERARFRAESDAVFRDVGRTVAPVLHLRDKGRTLVERELGTLSAGWQAALGRAADRLRDDLAAGRSWDQIIRSIRTYPEWIIARSEVRRSMDTIAGDERSIEALEVALDDRLQDVPDAPHEAQEAIAFMRDADGLESALKHRRETIELALDEKISAEPRSIQTSRKMQRAMVEMALMPADLHEIAYPAPVKRDPDPVFVAGVSASPNQSAPASGPPRPSVQRGPARAAGRHVER